MNEWYQQETPEEIEARELCYTAQDSELIATKIQLALEAIRIFPNCIEAYRILCYCYFQNEQPEHRNLDLALEYITTAVERGGKIDFRGTLDGDKYYLRALYDKMHVLRLIGRIPESVEVGLQLCRMNLNHPASDLIMSDLFIRRDYDMIDKFCSRAVYGHEICYTRLLRDYVLHEEGTVSADCLRSSLARALSANPMVPNTLSIARFKFEANIAEENDNDDWKYKAYSNARYVEGAETYVLHHQGFAAWRSVPGALQWLCRDAKELHGALPPTAELLIKLLDTQSILIALRGKEPYGAIRSLIATRCMDKIVGSASAGFSLPIEFRNAPTANGKICAFNRTEDWKNNGFVYFTFDEVVQVPYWYLLLEHQQAEEAAAAAKLLSEQQRYCPLCIDREVKWLKEHDETTDNDEGFKAECRAAKAFKPVTKCTACRDLRKLNSICHVCLKHVPNMPGCGKCKAVSYCSPECQKKNWKDHKLICVSHRLLRTGGLAISPLESVFHYADICRVVVEFLVGEEVVNKPQRVVDLISLSRTSKAINESLLKLRVWNAINLSVDLSIVSTGYGVEDDDDDDWSWKPLQKSSTSIISTYVRYGGCNITCLGLCLRHVYDAALSIISRECRMLERISLTYCCSPKNTFFTTQGLVNFFDKVANSLQYVSITSHGYLDSYTLDRNVLEAIKRRKFQLKGLRITVRETIMPSVLDLITNNTPDDYDASGWLKALEIDAYPDESSQIMRSIVPRLSDSPAFSRSISSVQILNLTNMVSLTDSEIILIAAHVPNLKACNISIFGNNDSDVDGFTDNGLSMFAKKCRYLQTLDFSGRSNISMRGIEALLSNCGETLVSLGFANTGLSHSPQVYTDLLTIANICGPKKLIHIRYSHQDVSWGSVEKARKEGSKLASIMKRWPQILFCHDMIGLVPHLEASPAIQAVIERSKAAFEDDETAKKNGWVCSFADEKLY